MATIAILCRFLLQVRLPLSHHSYSYTPKRHSCFSRNFVVTPVASTYCSASVSLKVANKRHKQSISMATTAIMCMGQPQQIKIGWRYNHANLVRDAGCRWGSSGLLDYDGNDLQEVFTGNSRRTSTEFEQFRGSCDPSVTQR